MQKTLKSLGLFIGIIAASAIIVSCSEVDFSTNKSIQRQDPEAAPASPPVICDPLAEGEAECSEGKGLVGNLFYFSVAEHGAQFFDENYFFDPNFPEIIPGNHAKAGLDEYFQFASKVPNPIRLNAVNVPPVLWDTGFRAADGSVVKDQNDVELLEWFAIRVSGQINLNHLPPGDYQFATISDDGMRVFIGDQKQPLIDENSLHSPRMKCAQNTLSFTQGEEKTIRIEYFQGPAHEIAMQLLVRSGDQSEEPCQGNETEGWLEIPASSYRTGLQ